MKIFRRRADRIVFYILAIVVMLAVNFWLAHRATEVQRIRVSYTPAFLAQVGAGNVSEITSRGTAIQGDFKRPLTAHGPKRFATEVPAFADTNQLSQLLQQHRVAVNAAPLNNGSAPLWETLVFGFGPTILLVGLLVWFMRRARSGPLGGFGRSRARRYEPGRETVIFAEVAGIDEAKED